MHFLIQKKFQVSQAFNFSRELHACGVKLRLFNVAGCSVVQDGDET
jgi:hypothetical protein